ncbi:26S proteasome non-ATPase regulatory subunit 13-like B [Vitis vinifera]|uniref:26S proteasome non-ATPase regulatory subunit 13-like B n=1 Tax=Vitis vinifera TaxID=29760 RepID=A0A438H7N0_VITVI|nr:26S proteasome non-ATPase regulatory subunit 13-like B [Vitis vinifera]
MCTAEPLFSLFLFNLHTCKCLEGLAIKSLLGTKVEWLYYILQAFNSGDLVRYQELCRVHNAALSAQPALVQNEKKLLEKINILCLMEIIFSRPSEDRTIPLNIIAERTKLSVEDVEYLLMKSLSVTKRDSSALESYKDGCSDPEEERSKILSNLQFIRHASKVGGPVRWAEIA